MSFLGPEAISLLTLLGPCEIISGHMSENLDPSLSPGRTPAHRSPRERGSGRALLLTSLAVFLASSIWFSGTAAVPILKQAWSLSDVQSAWLTIAVQLGFIVGTFLYAVFNLPDIFSARRVFFVSACCGALFNGAFALLSQDLETALLFRFLTGVTLAGIYPVGMKIVASWFRAGLGWRLGIMVGALTLGTAVPYLIFALGAELPWRLLMTAASGLALSGGSVVLAAVPPGPYLREKARFNMRMAFRIFRCRDFRLQALGYFGHMWELYAFWSLAGLFLGSSFRMQSSPLVSRLPLICFLVIGVGALGCVLGGWASRFWGERRIALLSLWISGIFCLLSGVLFLLPGSMLTILALVWGFFVVADSPQFSALAAVTCPPEYTGTALTIQNGIGFGITVVAIQFIAWASQVTGWQWAFVFLTVGPAAGAAAMHRLGVARNSPSSSG